MTLRVPFDGFADAVRQFGEGVVAYVEAEGAYCVVTAAHRGDRLVSRAPLSVERAMAKLREAGLEPRVGRWVEDEEVGDHGATPFVAAVAYRTDEDKPGVWVDAFAELPTEVDALRAMYDEFTATGQVAEIDFEKFVTDIRATVVVVTPTELAEYVDAKSTPSA